MADGLFLNKQGLFCYGFNAMITAWGQFPKFIRIYFGLSFVFNTFAGNISLYLKIPLLTGGRARRATYREALCHARNIACNY